MLNGVTECLGVTGLNTRHTYLYTFTTRKPMKFSVEFQFVADSVKSIIKILITS